MLEPQTEKEKLSTGICTCGDDGCGDIELDYTENGSNGFSWSDVPNYLINNQRFQFISFSIAIAIIGLVFNLFIPETLNYFFLVASIIGIVVPAKLAYRSLKKRTLTINTLLVIATVSALILGLFEEAVILVVVFSLGEILESVLVKFTEKNFDTLKSFLPSTSNKLISPGDTVSVPTEDIEKGDRILVKTGDKIPVDGTVVDNKLEIRKSHLTGESRIEVVEPGKLIYAGSIVVSGSSYIDATVDGTNTTAHHIIQSVEDSLQRKSSAEKFSQKFGKYYTPSVFVLFLIISLVFPLFDNYDFSKWFNRGLVILVVSCACGLAVSVPVTIISAVSSAAKEGILIRGGTAIEKSAKVKTVVFDKTGTLTYGEPYVNDIVFIDDTEKEQWLPFIASITSRSNHPVSVGITKYIKDNNVSPSEDIRDFEEIPGYGVQAKVNGKTLAISRDNSDSFEERIEEHYGGYSSYSLLKLDEKVVGYVVFEDKIRENASQVISQLYDHDYRVVMITGDNQTTADYVADKLGIHDYKAGVLPDEKVEAIKEIQAMYGPVIMVGDGINDAPALAEADVGFAMGISGAELTADIADVVLTRDDLTGVLRTLLHSKRSFNIAKTNIGLALATVFGLLLLAALGILNLISGIIANEFTALLIIMNGLRPLYLKE